MAIVKFSEHQLARMREFVSSRAEYRQKLLMLAGDEDQSIEIQVAMRNKVGSYTGCQIKFRPGGASHAELKAIVIRYYHELEVAMTAALKEMGVEVED